MTPRAHRRRACSVAVCVACALIVAWPTAAGGSESVAAESARDAQAALESAEQALTEGSSGAPDRDATAALSQLAEALPALVDRDRRQAERILARPTDGNDDPQGFGYDVPAALVRSEPSSEDHFCVFWVATTEDAPDLDDNDGNDDGDGVPDYVEAILAIAEISYDVEVGELDWQEPKPDQEDECSPNPAGPQADIYLKQLGDQGLYGYEAPDSPPSQPANARSKFGFLVIDNDYAASEFPGYADRLDPARVTVAHEFNHLLQERYAAFQDLWMFESTATWMEEKVFPAVDDYLSFLAPFAATPGIPITEGMGLRIYATAVWSHWLESGYGPDVIRRAWEVSDRTQPRDFAIDAYARAISDLGGHGFSREFTRFAAATAEWRTGHGGFPDASRYPDMRRKGSLEPGARKAKRFRLNHAAYRLFRVKPARAPRIRLRVRAERGVRTGIALVARRGRTVSEGVKRKVHFLRRGGKDSVALGRLRRFERVTAVVVNADGRAREARFGAWDYRKDRSRFAARLERATAAR